jgi:protein-disulfide isomerase
MFKDKFVLVIVISSVLLLIGGFIFTSKTGSSSSLNPNYKKLLEVVSDDYIKGNKDASVTFIEYLDFECEACAFYYPLIKQLAGEFKNEVRFVNRYFPLPGHQNGLPAALAVEAAGKQGKYWEMHNILLGNQKSWGEKKSPGPAIFESYAKQIGLNMDQFKKDVNSPAVRDRVNRDKDSGTKLGISGTPTFYLNGEKLPNPRSVEDLKKTIQAAILKIPKPSITSTPIPAKVQ